MCMNYEMVSLRRREDDALQKNVLWHELLLSAKILRLQQ